jgi:hypothetical protein
MEVEAGGFSGVGPTASGTGGTAVMAPVSDRQTDDEPRAQRLGHDVEIGGRMFSAQITPPWASTICLEIARPRPEWLPNCFTGVRNRSG